MWRHYARWRAEHTAETEIKSRIIEKKQGCSYAAATVLAVPAALGCRRWKRIEVSARLST
jgi:hypothetical protein